MSTGTMITAAVLGLVALTTLQSVQTLVRDDQHRRNYVDVVRALRWWMLPAGVVHVVVVGGTFLALMAAVPVLKFGWWSLLGGNGNVALGQTTNPGFWWHTIAVVIPLVLLFLLPTLAYWEELAFRRGAEHQSVPSRLRRQTKFGLIHSLFGGVPLAAGLAIIIAGLIFERIYLTEVRRLQAQNPVPAEPGFVRIPAPARPHGPGYDGTAWQRYWRDYDAVETQNRIALDQWLDDSAPPRVREHIAGLQKQACATAAAFHAVTNAMLLVTLLWYLLFS